MKIFNNEGYISIPDIEKDAENNSFIVIIGRRGTGKTYGLLKYMIEEGRFFLLLRRTEETIKFLSTYTTSPIYSIDKSIAPFRQNKITSFAKYEKNEKGKLIKVGDDIGYMAAASAISGMRGFSGDMITDIIYDEFIPERGDIQRKGDFERLLNTYETINRNRELQGEPRVKLWLLSNANEFENFFFTGLGITDYVRRRANDDKIEFKSGGLVIYNIHKSPISRQKKNTALYKLTYNVSGADEFNKMALDNKFYFNDENIKKKPLNDYNQIAYCENGGFRVYVHKNEPIIYFTKFKISDKRRKEIKTAERFKSLVGFNPLLDVYFDSYKTRQNVQKFI